MRKRKLYLTPLSEVIYVSSRLLDALPKVSNIGNSGYGGGDKTGIESGGDVGGNTGITPPDPDEAKGAIWDDDSFGEDW